MTINRIKKTSDLEKRMRILKSQIYGKNPGDQYISKSVNQKKHTSDIPTHRYTDTLISSDISYLYRDLFKILTFSSIAIGTQIVLYFALSKNLIRLPLW